MYPRYIPVVKSESALVKEEDIRQKNVCTLARVLAMSGCCRGERCWDYTDNILMSLWCDFLTYPAGPCDDLHSATKTETVRGHLKSGKIKYYQKDDLSIQDIGTHHASPSYYLFPSSYSPIFTNSQIHCNVVDMSKSLRGG